MTNSAAAVIIVGKIFWNSSRVMHAPFVEDFLHLCTLFPEYPIPHQALATLLYKLNCLDCKFCFIGEMGRGVKHISVNTGATRNATHTTESDRACRTLLGYRSHLRFQECSDLGPNRDGDRESCSREKEKSRMHKGPASLGRQRGYSGPDGFVYLHWRKMMQCANCVHMCFFQKANFLSVQHRNIQMSIK